MSTLNGAAFFNSYPSVPASMPAPVHEAASTAYRSESAVGATSTSSTSSSSAAPLSAPGINSVPAALPGPNGYPRRRAPSSSRASSPSGSRSPERHRSPRRASKIPRVTSDGRRESRGSAGAGDAMMVDSPQVDPSSSTHSGPGPGLVPGPGPGPGPGPASTIQEVDSASAAPTSATTSTPSHGSSGPASCSTGTGSGTPSTSHSRPPSGPLPDGDRADERRIVSPTLAEAELEDVLIMVADMLTRLLEHNDSLPAPAQGDKAGSKWGSTGALTRFHSRVVPGISVQGYMMRMARYTSLEKVCVLLVLVYIDRIAAAQSQSQSQSQQTGEGSNPDSEEGNAFSSYSPSSEPRFTLCSLTVHRFVCAAIVCSSKALCDSFATNAHYAKVGGISLQELNVLEKELLRLIRWRLVCSPELLEQYYRSLVAAHPSYVLAEPRP